ncbi:MAG TPA: PA0069 family radical SAM protein [Bacteroidetes bacterium]|nr:PA0069 family radical SAM protein [Bacteroidota bacterium]
MQIVTPYIKGRGAQINTPNQFQELVYDEDPAVNLDDGEKLKTEYINVHPKTMLNKVSSPDIPLDWSMNPYQGCEHGCVYCYARNTHPYWGYSAGTDFEQKILVKKNAAELVEKKIKHPNWKAAPIMLSGNTDCYQPIEKKLEITRSILKVLWKYRHPVGIVTKNSLILRDLDILSKMAGHDLVHVAISITTLDEGLRRLLEPRTASVHSRLHTIEKLSKFNIPVKAMFAPVIPGLNDHEVFKVAEYTSKLGARGLAYTMVRLNGDVGLIFEDWIRKALPDRADKVLGKIKNCHGGQLKDSRFGKRMRGEGNYADIIHAQFRLAKKKYFAGKTTPAYNIGLHEKVKNPQLTLFG